MHNFLFDTARKANVNLSDIRHCGNNLVWGMWRGIPSQSNITYHVDFGGQLGCTLSEHMLAVWYRGQTQSISENRMVK